MILLEYELRERRLSHVDLERQSGVNRVIISKIINGHEKAWPKWRNAIAVALNWPLDEADQLFKTIQVVHHE